MTIRASNRATNMVNSAIPLLVMSDRQDLYSMAYVRAIVAAAGFNFSKSELDRNSADMQVEHVQSEGFYPTYGRLLVQVKCTYARGISSDNTIHFPLPARNYNQLRQDKIEPRILVVVHVPRPDGPDAVPWIECADGHTVFRYRAYWISLMGMEETTNQDNVTVRIPVANVFDVEAVRRLMDEVVAQGKKRP